MKRLYYVLPLVSVLFGCTTVPTPIEEAEAVPENRILSKLKVTSENPARLTVIRDRAAVGGTVVSFYFEVNGAPVVKLRTGETYTTLIDPGEVFLSVRTDAIGATNKPLQIETVLRPSKHYVYRVGNDGNWLPHIQRDFELSDKH